MCLRPDGKPCPHEEKWHLTMPHPLVTGYPWGCEKCWFQDGMPLIGPYIHAYNTNAVLASQTETRDES